MRTNIVAGNWKMNNTLEEGNKLANEVLTSTTGNEPSQIILGVPFVHLAGLASGIGSKSGIGIAAQNCSDKPSGAYTGEVSAAMIKSTGADSVIIGHSERRQYFNETNEQLAAKVNLALANQLTPIFCCGETLEIRKSGNHFDYVCQQLTESLFHLSEGGFADIVIAYEPIWAIGTGVTASSDQAQEMHAVLRAHLATKFGATTADDCSILYGGSCKPSNARELFSCADVDGGLIGGASLNADDFMAIVNSF